MTETKGIRKSTTDPDCGFMSIEKLRIAPSENKKDSERID